MRLPRLSHLQWALAVSLALHAGVLTLRIADPERFNRVFQDTPLEVVLVNQRSSTPPEKAQAIAQAALAGGGDAATGRATSPLPPSAWVSSGDDVEDAQRQLEALQAQQALLLADLKKQLAALQPPDPPSNQTPSEVAAREEKRRQFVDLLAEIEKRINEENARPKKRYISPATREEVYALYYDALRRRIEERGTQNFPAVGGVKLYGELTMIVTVNADGRVLDTEVVVPSANRTLDRRAEAIVRSAAPFGAFSPAMRRQADQIVVVSRFNFTREETLETTLSK